MPLLLRSEEHTSELQSPCNLVCRFFFDRKSTRLNSSHLVISYAVFCLKKKKNINPTNLLRMIGPAFLTTMTVQLESQPPNSCCSSFFFFFNDPGPTEIYPLPLHDPLPI